jgi:hypothetical protein
VEAVQVALVVLLHAFISETVQQANRIIPLHVAHVTVTSRIVQFVFEVAASDVGHRVIQAVGNVGFHHPLAPVDVIKVWVNEAVGPIRLVLRHSTAWAEREICVVRGRQGVVQQVYARIPTAFVGEVVLRDVRTFNVQEDFLIAFGRVVQTLDHHAGELFEIGLEIVERPRIYQIHRLWLEGRVNVDLIWYVDIQVTPSERRLISLECDQQAIGVRICTIEVRWVPSLKELVVLVKEVARTDIDPVIFLIEQSVVYTRHWLEVNDHLIVC